ncbi:MAG: YCF48-related protein [Ignavibacteria bacterium]|nr:YCF48-related protein [Ignavibacteria bacterium]
MKKYIIVFFLFLLCPRFTASQPLYWNWVPVTSPVTANLNSAEIYNVEMLIAGNSGTILLSTGGGSDWTVLNSATSADLFGVTAYQQQFVCGANGFVSRASNNLTVWTACSLPVGQNVNSITGAPAASYKLVCGDNGIIYWTTNNGTNWSLISSGTANNLRCASFDNYLSIYRTYICGDNGTFRKLVYTLPPVPPAITLFTINTGFPNHFYAVKGIADTSVILMAGSGGIILKSTNSGLNWFQQNSGTTKNLRDIFAVNQNDIWICGDQGTVLHTTNGGTDWFPQPVQSTADIKSILILSSTKGFAFGAGGTILKCEFPNPLSDTTVKWALLDGNNISAVFSSSGVFDQSRTGVNLPGFEWPKGTGKMAIFSSGLSVAAMVNGQIRQAMCSYTGEFKQGRIVSGSPQLPIELNKVWKVKSTENCNNSVDWANWGLVVPYGAPYRDVNNNGVYDPCTDIPGVRNSAQTIFMALTDGFLSSHKASEGFGGGTLPLNADMKITAWCYTDSVVADVQFMKFDIINRGASAWNNLYFAFVGDYDLGNAVDDFLCMDSTRNMWIGYNGDNDDAVYGPNPPAVGIRVLKFPVNKNNVPFDTIKTTSGVQFISAGAAPPLCETDPNGEPNGAYNMMKGFKKDMSKWMNPTFIPPRPVKFIYGGEPEPNTGWTELKGSIWNCGGDTGAYHPVNAPGDRRYVLSMGRDNFTMNPGDSVSILAAQLIARGTSNTNSVTKLKQLSDLLLTYLNTGIAPIGNEIPVRYSLSQNYPNPFNPVTKIRFAIEKTENRKQNTVVKIAVYDITGREVETLVNEALQPGIYEVTFNGSGLSSGVYFYKIVAGNYSETKRMVLLK